MKKLIDTLQKYWKTALVAAVAVGAALKPLFDLLQEMLDLL